MKKLFVIGILLGAAVGAWQKGMIKMPQAAAGLFGARAESSSTRLFVGPNCGTPCSDVRGMLTSRGVQFEELDVSTGAGQEYGVNRYPLTQAGGREVLGNAGDDVVSMLAEAYGDKVLTPVEQSVMRGHFGADGKPVVVVYGASWCGYCKRERELLQSKGVAHVWVDVEVDPAGRLAYDTLHGRGYPLTYVGYRRLHGYNESELQAAISELM